MDPEINNKMNIDIRRPVFSGMFYENDFQSLNKQIEKCFTKELGPGSLPVKRSSREILGIISPHAGYDYSGMCAAWGYKEIAESRMADVYVILGPNHTGLGYDSVLLSNWYTPLGLVKTHRVFAQDLIQKTGLSSDQSAHMQEHSIEVQLPFLQFASKDRLEKLKVVCISLMNPDKITKIASAINQISDERNLRICIIASSDFTHFGERFDYVPFRYNIKENINHLDMEAIEHIKSLDSEKFLKLIKNNQATICGYLPIAVIIETFRQKAEKVRLLQYYTSGDLTKDYDNSVSYASLLFE
ncbi:MAG: AmmeMemoRadiSam system protein B [Candidatus Woesearchaeota archaeon]